MEGKKGRREGAWQGGAGDFPKKYMTYMYMTLGVLLALVDGQ